MFVFRITMCLVAMSGGIPLACLWDYDTLKMERAAVPTAHEAIVGYFARHSDHYYRWRIKNRSSIRVNERSPADYDDIAVAHEKLGDHDEAIRIIQEKIQRWPDDHRYESEANLATFLIHAGRLHEGLTHIDQALAINPDAHFGREIYQRHLVEFLIEDAVKDESKPNRRSHSFDEYLFHKRDTTHSPENQVSEYQSAVTGLVGMIRFGNHDSPALLGALGDLLSSHLPLDDRASANANRLGARAYLVAASISKEPMKSRYREQAELAIAMQVGETLEAIEQELKQELAQAKDLASRITADEKRWAEQGLDLDAMFAETYSEIAPLRVSTLSEWKARSRILGLITVVIVIAVAVSRIKASFKRRWNLSSQADLLTTE